MDLTHLFIYQSLTLENKFLYILELLKKRDDHKLIEPKCSFDPKTLDESSCLRFFRFEKDDLIRLKNALRLPDKMCCNNGLVFTGIEGLCVLLRRLAYPNRYWDISELFNRKQLDLSRIFSTVLDYIYDNFKCLVTNLKHEWMTPAVLVDYANTINSHGSPLKNCMGFIDGTLRPTCRPSIGQQEAYSGHKRVHGIKFQSIVVPSGIMVNLHGPELARRHDSYMLARSSILEKLEEFPNYCVFGDQGYPIRPQLMVSFRGNLTSDQKKIQQSYEPTTRLR